MAFWQLMEARKLIAWNLRKHRVAKGLSQEKLALEAGVDRSYVGRIERGTENVTISTLEQLAQILSVRVRDLFNDPEPREKPPLGLASGRKRKN